MIAGEALRMALRQLWSHKARSALTIAGVVIGVTSVLAVTSLGTALESSLVSSLNSDEDRQIYITASIGDPTTGPPSAGQFGLIFTDVDREALLSLDGVETVIAGGTVGISGLRLSGGDTVPFQSVTATRSDDLAIADPDLYEDGEVFEDGEDEVVLGATIASRLDDPEVGDSLEFLLTDGGSRNATIVGILAEQEPSFISLSGNTNSEVYVPVDPFYTTRIDSPSTEESVLVYRNLVVVVEDITMVDEVKKEVEDYLEDDSDAEQLRQDDVNILVADAGDIQEGISDALAQVTVFIAAIAGMSLLVGGVMIGTIMLITVTERTKEIGMMKAIGAYNGEILRMFLMEAAIIGFVGSLVGILFGVLFGFILVSTLFAAEDGIQFAMPWAWVGYAVLVGILTGVVAGFFPARRATKIAPVEALSYE